MNKATRDRIQRKAKAAVKGNHGGAEEGLVLPAEATAKPAKAKVSKVVREGAMPALPKLPSASRSRKPRPTQPCACGCETPTTSKWAPGHDARARGWAIRIEREICKMSDVPANERAGAKIMLEARKAGGGEKGQGIKLAKSDKKTAREAAAAPAAEAVNS